jgi:hypothetical protein
LSLMEAFLGGSLVLILTEYGLTSRAAAIQHLTGGWRWSSALTRWAVWIAVALLTGVFRTPAGWLQVIEAVVVTELGAVVLRRRVSADVKHSAPHGRPWTHLIPFGAGLLRAAVVRISLDLARTPATPLLAPPVDQDLLVAFGVSLLWTWGTLATVSVIEVARPLRDDEDSAARPGGGEIIGLLERILVFVLVLAGSLTSVGFIVAFKSAARFPQFKDPDFAEYFLIGTLTSIGLATLLGLLIGTLI